MQPQAVDADTLGYTRPTSVSLTLSDSCSPPSVPSPFFLLLTEPLT